MRREVNDEFSEVEVIIRQSPSWQIKYGIFIVTFFLLMVFYWFINKDFVIYSNGNITYPEHIGNDTNSIMVKLYNLNPNPSFVKIGDEINLMSGEKFGTIEKINHISDTSVVMVKIFYNCENLPKSKNISIQIKSVTSLIEIK
ncbi:MAG: hypothetical protein U0W65_11805 [Bacteroidia bacterium]